MTPERYRKIIEVLSLRQADFTLICDGLENNQNIAAMRRTCDALGIPEMHAVEADDQLRRRHAGIAAGAHKWVELHRYATVSEPIERCRNAGMTIVATALGDGAVSYLDYDFTQPTAVVLGAEIAGVSDAAIESADQLIRVDMLGMVESLNVSVAWAIIAAEARRQRILAGKFDAPTLTEVARMRKAVQWGHPRVAERCDAQNIPYPQLDENGNIQSS